MSRGTSIVGTWNIFVDWGCDGNPVQASPFTFNSDGTWTYQFGGGRWIQVEGMAFWNFENAQGLIYTANVTRNGMAGIQGYASPPPNPGKGCFCATRQEGSGTIAATTMSEGFDIAVASQPATVTTTEAAGGFDIAVGTQ